MGIFILSLYFSFFLLHYYRYSFSNELPGASHFNQLIGQTGNTATRLCVLSHRYIISMLPSRHFKTRVLFWKRPLYQTHAPFQAFHLRRHHNSILTNNYCSYVPWLDANFSPLQKLSVTGKTFRRLRSSTMTYFSLLITELLRTRSGSHLCLTTLNFFLQSIIFIHFSSPHDVQLNYIFI